MLQFALVLGLFLVHAPTTNAVRSGNGLRHRASVAPEWIAPDFKTEDKQCTKYKGRWPSKTKWGSGPSDNFKCCREFNCRKKRLGIDCRQYPAPIDLDQKKWKDTMVKFFGDNDEKVLVESVADKETFEEKLAGHRAVSLDMLKKIADAAKEMFPTNGKLKVVNKKFYPNGIDKTYQDLTMHDINGLVGMPLAASTHLSFAGHVGGGKPTFFISHNWAGRFDKFVKSAEKHFEYKVKEKGLKLDQKNTFYWVCTFANNQFDLQLDDKPQDGPFALAIQTAKAQGQGGDVVAIQDDTSPLTDNFGNGLKAEYYTPGRIWCAFEYFYAILQEAPIYFNTGSTNTLMDATGKLLGDKPIGCFKERMLAYDWGAMIKKNDPTAVKNIQEYMKTQESVFKEKVAAHPQYKDYQPQKVTAENGCSKRTDCCCRKKTGSDKALKEKKLNSDKGGQLCGADFETVPFSLCEMKAGAEADLYILFNTVMAGILKDVDSDKCSGVEFNGNPVGQYGDGPRRNSVQHNWRGAGPGAGADPQAAGAAQGADQGAAAAAPQIFTQ